jgi:glycosyltransferase involved in cell wall biosynthesis
MLILDVPIEPLPMRYSEQWASWFRDGFLLRGHDVEQVLGGTSRRGIRTGAFLDCYDTTRWKATQLVELASKLEALPQGKRVTVFVHDGWFPGIEALAYIRDIAGLDLRIAAYMHAGSYDSTDLLGELGCARWAEGHERGWLSLYDAVFVGTNYHRTLLASRGDVSKVHVVGNPVAVGQEPAKVREPLVVWPHRLTPDKNPRALDALRGRYGSRLVVTQEQKLVKADYYALLSQAACVVSAAWHENFGIAMVEAAARGCVPVAPDRLAYPEMFGTLYQTEAEMFSQIDQALETCEAWSGATWLRSRYAPARVVQRVVERLEKWA